MLQSGLGGRLVLKQIRTRTRGVVKHSAPIFFVLAAVFAAVAGVLVYIALQKAAPVVPVTVAAREIPAYSVLEEKDLEVVSVPAGGIPAGAMDSKGGIVGSYVNRALLPGDFIRDGHLSDDPMPAGPLAAALADIFAGGERVALSLPGELAPGIVPDLVSGDRLMVLGYVPDAVGPEAGQAVARVLAPAAVVLQVTVPTDMAGDTSIREATVVVAVKEEEALSIMRAEADGVVALALLSPTKGVQN